jgi:hypothetical protein
MVTPEETMASVAIPDSITNAQNATIANAISDCPSTETGLAWAARGTIISHNASDTRGLMPNLTGQPGHRHAFRARGPRKRA